MTEVIEAITLEETSEQMNGPAPDEQATEALEIFDLKLMPPKWTYTAQAQFHYVGRGAPLPYDFGDIFAAEAEGEE